MVPMNTQDIQKKEFEHLLFLILQFLRELNLMEACHELERTYALYFDVIYFKELIVQGAWDALEHYLTGFTAYLSVAILAAVLFEINRQRFIETLERGEYELADDILRTKLSPVYGFQDPLITELSSMRFNNRHQHEEVRSWRENMPVKLLQLIRIDPSLKSKLELPQVYDERLIDLARQSLEAQFSNCQCPRDLWSLLKDHLCQDQAGPSQQVDPGEVALRNGSAAVANKRRSKGKTNAEASGSILDHLKETTAAAANNTTSLQQESIAVAPSPVAIRPVTITGASSTQAFRLGSTSARTTSIDPFISTRPGTQSLNVEARANASLDSSVARKRTKTIPESRSQALAPPPNPAVSAASPQHTPATISESRPKRVRKASIRILSPASSPPRHTNSEAFPSSLLLPALQDSDHAGPSSAKKARVQKRKKRTRPEGQPKQVVNQPRQLPPPAASEEEAEETDLVPEIAETLLLLAEGDKPAAKQAFEGPSKKRRT